MIGYFILLISLGSLIYLANLINKKDWFAPSTVIIILLFISTIAAMIGRNSWNYNKSDISITTYAIIIGSSIAFLFGSQCANIRFIINKRFSKIKTKSTNNIQLKNSYFYLSNIQYIFLLIIEILLFLLFYYLLSLTYNTTNIALLIYYGHESFFWKSLIKNPVAQTYARYIFYLIKAIAYAFIYIFCHNVTIKNINGKPFLFIPIVIYAITWILYGSRHNVMLVAITLIIAIYVNIIKYNRINKNELKRILIPLSLVAIILVLVFFLGMATIWATNNDDAIAYVSFTFGCPIPTMNEALKIKQGFDSNQVFGSTTFSGLYRLLNRIGLIREITESGKGWIDFQYINGTKFSSSNTFSAPYNLYFDFGYLGMLLFSAIEGFIFSKLYLWVFSKRSSIIKFMLFIYFFPNLFNWFRTEDLLASNLSQTSTYICIILSILLVKVFFKYKPIK